ncbi:EamA-like transporter family protein [Massilia sp. PDC64]|nr:DMT family transporter [Massilia sp. PDC64]SDF01215.1 EamA-like transporter family protein [Massilia sp. PDC64]
MSDKTLGYVYLTLAMVLVGSTVVASKIAATGLPPFTATALRFALALPCFLVLLRVSGQRLPRPGLRDGALLVVQGLAGTAGYTALLMAGLRATSALDAGVILGTLPVVSAVVAVLVLGERPRPALIATIVLAGVGLFVLQPAGRSAGSMTGNALVFGAVLCEALFILLNKRVRIAVSPLALSTLMSAIGLAASLPFALAEGASPAVSPAALLAVAYYALLPTVGGFLLWYAGTARVGGTEAALFTALAPVAALLLAALLLDEPVNARQLAGIAFVLAAVGVSVLPAAYRAQSLPPTP